MADFEFEITESDEMVDLEEYFNYLIIERCCFFSHSVTGSSSN